MSTAPIGIADLSEGVQLVRLGQDGVLHDGALGNVRAVHDHRGRPGRRLRRRRRDLLAYGERPRSAPGSGLSAELPHQLHRERLHPADLWGIRRPVRPQEAQHGAVCVRRLRVRALLFFLNGDKWHLGAIAVVPSNILVGCSLVGYDAIFCDISNEEKCDWTFP